jgi:predicted pyridoxine 5'-phosphate oxidase superfamily flavin-nucleotide-binding protein
MDLPQPATAVSPPGSAGERLLQARSGSAGRAEAFYRRQMLHHLNERMIQFVRQAQMLWVATADAGGACDCSFRAGPAGFVQVLDARTLRYPEYRGNGVLASLGNIVENPHVGLFFIDFTDALIGLHVNGQARVIDGPATAASRNGGGPRAERWVEVAVEEAYIHCRKHIPRMVPAPRQLRAWGTDDIQAKGGDYFGAACESRPER